VAGVIAGCGNASYRQGRGLLKKKDPAAIRLLEAAESEKSADWKIKRDLGIAYYQDRQYLRAIQKLAQAQKLRRNDGRTLLYIGLCLEQIGKFAEAVSVYRLYTKLSFLDPLKKELQARIREIQLRDLQQQVRQNLNDPDRLPPADPNTVAILYFRNLSQSNEMAPLLKGIADILTTDLGKVKRLRLVERIKLQILLDEIKLASSDLFDQLQAPQAGKLLGASQLISGGITRLNETQVQINAGVVATNTGALRGDGAQTVGNVSDLLQMEKSLVFDLIKDLGITLTDAEAEAIKPLPTKNILAFIAYSKGLDLEDRGQYEQAREEYAKAVKLDPNFAQAKQKQEQLAVQRLSLATIEKLAAFEERLAGTDPTLLDTGSRLGLKFGLDLRDGTILDPDLLSGTGVITITGDVPPNN
jgi:tetratricopeptide (TPR) repeat protein